MTRRQPLFVARGHNPRARRILFCRGALIFRMLARAMAGSAARVCGINRTLHAPSIPTPLGYVVARAAERESCLACGLPVFE